MSRKLKAMTQFISRINENTAIPLKVIVPVVITIVSATWYLASRQNETVAKLKQIEEGMWTNEEMVKWAARFQKWNPELDVPEPGVIATERKNAERVAQK